MTTPRRPLLVLVTLTLATLAFSGLSPDAELPKPERPHEAQRRQQESEHRLALPLFTASAAIAEKWFVWEGLPHPGWEKDLFAAEKSRTPTAQIHGETFYSRAAALRPDDRAAFIDLISNRENFSVYGGPKLCGGFHADHALEWRANERVYRALVCFGCHEIKFVSDDITLLCDLPKPTYEKLVAMFKPYRRERPQR